jgi:hypothetical protein
MSTTDDFVMKQIPREVRIRNTTITLFVTVGITAFALWHLLSGQQLRLDALWLLPSIFIGLWISYRYWTTTEVKELTREASERKQCVEADIRKREEDFEDSWYFRYPVAGVMLWCAWYILTTKSKLWWMAILLVLVAFVFAREVSKVLLAIGMVVLIVYGISLLSVSVAVIFGAIIIALALKR